MINNVISELEAEWENLSKQRKHAIERILSKVKEERQDKIIPGQISIEDILNKKNNSREKNDYET